MKFIVPIFLAALLLWKSDDHTWRALYLERWGILIFGLGFFGIWKLRMRSPAFTAFLGYYWLMLTLSGYLAGFHPGDQEVTTLLSSASRDQALGMFGFLGFLWFRLDLHQDLRWVGWAALAAIALSAHPSLDVLLLQNPSMAAVFVVLSTGPWAGLIATGLTHSWTAALALAVLVLSRLRRRFVIPVALMATAALIAVAVILWRAGGIPDNGRIALWREYLIWWLDQGPVRIAFGVGPGTSRVWLPLLALSHDRRDGMLYLWAHSDWLQLLVETGVVGASLGAFALWKLLRVSSERDRAVILALVVAMCSNFPMHWALQALVGWSLISRNALRKGNYGEQDVRAAE